VSLDGCELVADGLVDTFFRLCLLIELGKSFAKVVIVPFDALVQDFWELMTLPVFFNACDVWFWFLACGYIGAAYSLDACTVITRERQARRFAINLPLTLYRQKFLITERKTDPDFPIVALITWVLTSF
jgi:hypothetical protein